MKVISQEILYNFCRKYTDVRNQLLSWLNEVLNSEWKKPSDIKSRHKSASFVSNNIVWFNIKGKKYRLKTIVAYQTQTVFIEWIGTHAEYNKLKHK